MSKTLIAASFATALAATAAFSQPANPDLAGTYGCKAETENGCIWSGSTFTITQTGKALDVKNDKGAIGTGHITSPITISMGPPWNMFGVIHEAGSIDWSNGTQWKKQ